MSKRKPRSAPAADLSAIAEQVALPPPPAEIVIDEITEQEDHSEPSEDAKPTRQVGMSNLAQTIRSHRKNYVPALHPVSGKKTMHNDDFVAHTLMRVPLPVLEAFVYGTFGKSYEKLNPGHRRMCCGNIIRAEFKKDNPIVAEWLGKHAVVEEAEEDAA